jgi:hypothetical protein
MPNTALTNIYQNKPKLRPEWVRVPDAVHLSGLSRSSIYELIKAGKIRSFSKRERGAVRGIRLIFLDSLLDHIEQMYKAATARMEVEVAND